MLKVKLELISFWKKCYQYSLCEIIVLDRDIGVLQREFSSWLLKYMSCIYIHNVSMYILNIYIQWIYIHIYTLYTYTYIEYIYMHIHTYWKYIYTYILFLVRAWISSPVPNSDTLKLQGKLTLTNSLKVKEQSFLLVHCVLFSWIFLNL